MQTASRANRKTTPASLRERLALLECGIVPVPPPRGRRGARPSAGKRARGFAGKSFLVGLVCGGALGSATLLATVFAHPGQMRARLHHILALSPTIARLGPRQPASHQHRDAGEIGTPTQSTFQITVDRGVGGTVKLPLRVVGLAGSQDAEVVLRGLPTEAQLSRGERRAEGTWALRPAELEDLQLTLGDGAPKTFDMTVEVADASGERMATAIAHVQLSDRLGLARITPPRRPAAADRAVAPMAPPTAPRAQAASPPFHTEVNALAHAEEPMQAAAARPPLPEGVSSLGGPMGDPASVSAAPQEHRAVWWKLPQPAWTPFADRLSEH